MAIIVSKSYKDKEMLIDMARLQDSVRKQIDPDEYEVLLQQEKIIDLCYVILERFGLPGNPDYLNLLQFDILPDVNGLEKKLKQLQDAATEYLMSDIPTDLELLKEGQMGKLNECYILPEIGVKPNVYTKFVYNIILLKGNDTVEAVLEELRFVKNNPEVLEIIIEIESQYIPDSSYPICQPDILYTLDKEYQYLHPWQIADLLEVKGVKYIRPFLVYLSGLIGDDELGELIF